MRARIIYLLFVLLLAMTWSAENMTPERTSCDMPHACNTHIAPATSIPLYIRMSAEVCLISFAMDTATILSLQKALPRYRSDAPAMRPERLKPDATARPKRSDMTSRTADHYVFTLERILV